MNTRERERERRTYRRWRRCLRRIERRQFGIRSSPTSRQTSTSPLTLLLLLLLLLLLSHPFLSFLTFRDSSCPSSSLRCLSILLCLLIVVFKVEKEEVTLLLPFLPTNHLGNEEHNRSRPSFRTIHIINIYHNARSLFFFFFRFLYNDVSKTNDTIDR